MATTAQIAEERTVVEITAALLGRKCWNVACGGCVGATFQLALGGKIPRRRPLRNRTVSEEYRLNEGEFGLMVWCSWRLGDRKGPVTSWDDESPGRDEGLRGLRSRRIVKADVLRSWDLQVEFSGGMLLSVFPDHVGADASFDGNWEVWTPDLLYAVGTDLVCEVEPRESGSGPSGTGRVRAVRTRRRRTHESGVRRASGAK